MKTNYMSLNLKNIQKQKKIIHEITGQVLKIPNDPTLIANAIKTKFTILFATKSSNDVVLKLDITKLKENFDNITITHILKILRKAGFDVEKNTIYLNTNKTIFFK